MRDRDALIEVMKAGAISAGKGEPSWADCVTDAEWEAALAALEAAGVRLDQCLALKKENESLRDALKPFAEYAKALRLTPNRHRDKDVYYTINRKSLTVGDFRRATLNQEPGQ